MKKIRKSLVCFYDRAGRTLMQDRRNYKKGSEFGFFGGSMEKDETPETALLREIEEELSIKLRQFDFVKEFKEITQEHDLIFYLYAAPLPSSEERVCKEGKPVFTTLDNALLLDLAERGKLILKEYISWLKKTDRTI